MVAARLASIPWASYLHHNKAWALDGHFLQPSQNRFVLRQPPGSIQDHKRYHFAVIDTATRCQDRKTAAFDDDCRSISF